MTPYAVVPDPIVQALPRLSGQAARLAIAIGQHMDGKGECYPSVRTLQRLARLRQWERFQAARAELEALGLQCIRRGRRTLYRWPACRKPGDECVPQGHTIESGAERDCVPQGHTQDVPQGHTEHSHLTCEDQTPPSPPREDTKSAKPKTRRAGAGEHKRSPTGGGKPSAEERRAEAAKRVISAYGEKVKAPRYDTSRTQAKRNVVNLLKGGEQDEAALLRAVEHYGVWCDRMGRAPEHRKNSGNFFGREAVYLDFTAEDWQPPEATPGTRSSRSPTRPEDMPL